MSRLPALALALSLWSTLSLAQDQFDPSSYLKAKDSTHQLGEGEVLINSVRYRVFTSPNGDLYVPALEHVSKNDLERGLCADQVPQLIERCAADDPGCTQRNKQRLATEVTVVRTDTPLTDNTKAYTELITTTIHRKCGEVPQEYFLGPILKPEIGLEYKDPKQRDASVYKLYNEGLRPEPGFKSEF